MSVNVPETRLSAEILGTAIFYPDKMLGKQPRRRGNSMRAPGSAFTPPAGRLPVVASSSLRSI